MTPIKPISPTDLKAMEITNNRKKVNDLIDTINQEIIYKREKYSSFSDLTITIYRDLSIGIVQEIIRQYKKVGWPRVTVYRIKENGKVTTCFVLYFYL